MATNLAKAVAFCLAATVVLHPASLSYIRPLLRDAWMIVFVLISIGTGDRVGMLRRDLKIARAMYARHQADAE